MHGHFEVSILAVPPCPNPVSLLCFPGHGHIVKRQSDDEEALEKQLCQDKGAGEWFRLETGDEKCRDVIQCTASVRTGKNKRGILNAASSAI